MALIAAIAALLLVLQLPMCEVKGELARKKYPAGWPVNELLIPAGSKNIRTVSIPGGETEINFVGTMPMPDAFKLIRANLEAEGWKKLDLGEKLTPPMDGFHYIAPNQQTRVKVYGDPVIADSSWSKAERKKKRLEVKYRYVVIRR